MIPIYKQLLLEKTFRIGKDVDMLYDEFFREDIDGVNNWLDGGSKHEVSIGRMITTSSRLTSADCKKAHAKKPIDIYRVNGQRISNHYNTRGSRIVLSLNMGAYNFIENTHNNSFSNDLKTSVTNGLPEDQQRAILIEFTATKMKSTIYHELSHWLDDVLHNGHISKMVNRSKQAQDWGEMDKAKHIMMQGKENVGLTTHEINAQIHAMKQLKRDIKPDIWNRLSFDDVIDISVPLKGIQKAINIKDRDQWRKTLLSRMNRENLLGDSMR